MHTATPNKAKTQSIIGVLFLLEDLNAGKDRNPRNSANDKWIDLVSILFKTGIQSENINNNGDAIHSWKTAQANATQYKSLEDGPNSALLPVSFSIKDFAALLSIEPPPRMA
jgi:hypothetical protein